MLQKLKNQLSTYGVLIAGLAFVMAITVFAGIWHYNQEVAAQRSKNTGRANTALAGIAQKQATGSASDSSAASPGNNSRNSSGAAKSTTQLSQTSRAATNSGQVATNSPPTQATVRASLSVNGYFKGLVTLSVGKNQCDLLSQALADHIISSLDMRYSPQYKTQGVYVIDGIGDPGSVWWTYKVNGKAPPYGCAGMTVHDGDSVNWQYVKS